MDIGSATVIAAAITAVGTVLVVLGQRGQKENKIDHASVSQQLNVMQNTLDRVEDKHDRHVEWHVTGETIGEPKARSRKRL